MQVKFTLLCLLGLVLSAGNVSANSEQDLLLGVNFSLQQYSNSDLSETYMPMAMVLRLGADVSPFFGFESRFGVGVISDKASESGRTVEVSNQALLGMYGKARLHLMPNASVYGMFGVSSFDVSAKSNINEEAIFRTDKSSLSLGAGLESRLVKNWLLNAELILYSPQSSKRLFAIELGGAYLF